MRKAFFLACTLSALTLAGSAVATGKAAGLPFEDAFDADSLASGVWKPFDRGEFEISNGVFRITDGWAVAGTPEWENYSVTFRARAPETARQVQIWAGFRHFNRDYRYLVALRGGNNNQLYLARYGAEGYDKMLDEIALDFSPAPGTWYTLKVTVAGNNIAVYLNDETAPRILVKEEDSPIQGGGISLGGSYLPAEFDSVSVVPVEATALDGVKKQQPLTASKEQKEAKRLMQRQAYRPFYVPTLINPRNEFPLAGNWLFIPEKEVKGNAAAPDYDDSHAHVMDVPNLWVPFAAWLEGESMPSGLNKGQNDKLHRLEEQRCSDYTFDYRSVESAWYRHYIDFPEDIASKEVVLDFQGIALISAIYFNGKKIQDQVGMFSPQKINLTGKVKPGRNVVAVQVWKQWKDDLSANVSATIDDNYADAWNIIANDQQGKVKKIDTGVRAEKLMQNHIPHGFYNTPVGIWRDVTLVITEKVKIEEFFFKPSLTGATIDVTYANRSEQPQDVTLTYEIKNCASGELLCEGTVEQKQLAAKEIRKTTFSTPVVQPKLWAPGQPNLYQITFRATQNQDVVDQLSDKVGFRTVEVRGQELLINGKPVWVRGANHMPGHMRPYDKDLAKKWMQLALEHNVVATRTHCSPYSREWLDAADETGVLISFEGPYPWLMLRDVPSKDAIEIWKREMGELVKANRNRPSVFLWTMNNEMKFFVNDDSMDLKIEKGGILTEGIQIVRQLDPTRPVVADSAYYRKYLTKKNLYKPVVVDHKLDDGDMDDPHGYFNWYNDSVFHFFKGEFGRDYHTPGRALMGQEISTGYPRADDALPARAYLFLHQTPQTTVGKDAYEECDPTYFITRHAMLTKELVEMFRRVEHERSNGLMVFAFHTWFYNNHEVNKVAPTLTADNLKQAYQPVLASAELWGRHFYAGDKLSAEVTLINDDEAFNTLTAPAVICQLTEGGRVIASQELSYGNVAYYATETKELNLPIPADLGKERVDGQLVLRVMVNGKQISKNEYDVILANKDWALAPRGQSKLPRVIVETDSKAKELLKLYGIKFSTVKSVAALKDVNSVLIVADPGKVSAYSSIAGFVKNGGKAILLNNQASVIALLPGLAQSYTPHRQEIVTMNVKEHRLFDGLESLDMAWFTDGREVPYAATGRYTLDRFNSNITALAETLKWHGYLNSPLEYQKIGGVPLFEAALENGKLLVSELRVDAVSFDPINGRIIGNILRYDFE